MEGQGRSRKVKKGHGWSFPITRLTIQVRKVLDGVVGWWCRIIVSAQSKSLSSGLWICDLNLGPEFGTGLGLDNNYERYTYLAESVCMSVSL